ncbi:MAG: hypothetical protein ACXQTG_00280 [Methanoculleaceae archaeon]
MPPPAIVEFIRLGRFPFTTVALLTFLHGARFTPARFVSGHAAMAAAHLPI